MATTSLYSKKRFPQFIQDGSFNIVDFIKAYYKALETPFYPLDMVQNLLDYYNLNNSYFKNLIESTPIISFVGDVITVKTTIGYPDSGFLEINGEYIRYEKRTDTTFELLKRGVDVLTLQQDNTFQISESPTTLPSHSPGDILYNVSYYFANWFFSKLKFELLNGFPETLNENLNLSSLLKTIKSFYLSKGTFNADKLFFKIVFNRYVIDVKLADPGTGAEFTATISNGSITGITIDSGGTGYTNTVTLTSTGNGVGAVFDVEVTDGVITNVTVVNGGSNYDSETVFTAKQKEFVIGDTVTGEFGGSGVIVRSNVNNISIFVDSNDFRYGELIYSDTVENTIETFVTKDVIPTKTYPIENTYKCSDSTSYSYHYISVSNAAGIDTLNDLKANNTFTYHICDETYVYYYDNPVRIIDPNGKITYSLNVSSIEKLVESTITRVLKVTSNTVVVDSAAGFPTNAGYFIANNLEYSYTNRDANQFYGVQKIGHSTDLVADDLIQLYGYDYSGTKVTNTLKTSDQEYLIEAKFFDTEVAINGSGFNSDLIFDLKDNRVNTLDVYTDDWRLNETYVLKDTVDKSDVYCDINAVYDMERDVYVTFNNVPNRSVDLASLGAYSQDNIKRIPKRQRVVDTISKNSNAIGLMLDGTPIQSFNGKKLSYGKYKSIKITNTGQHYPLVENGGTVVNPALSVRFSNGNYIYLEDQVKVYGSVKSVSILNIAANDLTGFIKKPTYTVTNAVGDDGNGLELEFKLSYTYEDDVVTNIKIIGIIVTNGGQNYTKKPTITIGGGGKTSTFNIPLDDVEIAGEVKFLDGTTDKDYTDIDLTGSVLASSTEPSSSLNSLQTIIHPTIEYGSGADIDVIIVEGSIDSVIINDGGQNYIKVPDLVVEGVGFDGRLSAVVTNGVITSVNIDDPGFGYSITPVVNIVIGGSGFATEATITEWTFNIPEIITTDAYGGFVYDPDIAEHAMSMNKSVLVSQQIQPGYAQVSYNHNATNNTYWDNSDVAHSNIIGWSYDGTPIYSAHRAYVYALDSASLSSSALTSSYNLKGAPDDFRPPTGTYPFGYFVEDYEYVAGSGDLDEYNGRFCITPEFPEGKYCYFATDTFPYFIGFNHKFTKDPFNSFPYSSIDYLDKNFLRVHYNNTRYPYQDNNLGSSNIKVLSVESGSVEEVLIEVSGTSYSLDDQVIVDNTNTFGTGLTCSISQITGVSVDSFSYNSGNKQVTVTTTTDHTLLQNDKIIIDKEVINNAIDANTTFTIDTNTTNDTVVNVLNYRFEIDASYVDGGSNLYTINLARDSIGVNKIYVDGYDFNRRNIEINTSDLPNIFYAIITNADGTIEKSVKFNNVEFDIYTEKSLDSVTATTFTFTVNDLADLLNTHFEINSYNVTETSNGYTSSIKKIDVLSGGTGYKDTPKLTVLSDTGDGVALNCYGSNIGKIKNTVINKNTNFCLGYAQDYYETKNYYTGKLKENYELIDVTLESPFTLEGVNPVVTISGTGTEVDVSFSFTGNYYFDIELNETIAPLDSERALNVTFQSQSSFSGTQSSFLINTTDDVQITSPAVNDTLVFRNGAFQSETEYSFSNDSLVFNNGNEPQLGEDVFVYHLNGSTFTIIPDNNIVFTDNGSSYEFDISAQTTGSVGNRLLVFLEGVLQSKSLWTYSSGVITFNQSYEYTNPITVEIVLLDADYSFYTTNDNSLQTTDTNGYYTYSGFNSTNISNIIINYNGVVQRYDSQFIENNTDTLSATPVDAIEILNGPGTNAEVFVYDLSGSWDYGNLVITESFTLFDVIPTYRRLPIPVNRKLYTTNGDVLNIVDSRDNGNIVFYTNVDIENTLATDTTLEFIDGSGYGTLYKVEKAQLRTFISSNVTKNIVNKNTKISDRYSKIASEYYNPYTIDVGYVVEADEWKENYKNINKPVGIKAYVTNNFETFYSINNIERSSATLEIT